MKKRAKTNHNEKTKPIHGIKTLKTRQLSDFMMNNETTTEP